MEFHKSQRLSVSRKLNLGRRYVEVDQKLLAGKLEIQAGIALRRFSATNDKPSNGLFGVTARPAVSTIYGRRTSSGLSAVSSKRKGVSAFGPSAAF